MIAEGELTAASAVPTLSGSACPILPSPGDKDWNPPRCQEWAKGKKEQAERDKALEDALGRNVSTRTEENPLQGGLVFPSLPCRARVLQLLLGTRAGFCPLIPEHLRAEPSRIPLQRLPLARSHQSLCKPNEIPGDSALGTCPLLLLSGKGTCPCQALAVPAPKKTSLFCPLKKEKLPPLSSGLL